MYVYNSQVMAGTTAVATKVEIPRAEVDSREVGTMDNRTGGLSLEGRWVR